MKLLIIAIGGGIGSVLRYLASSAMMNLFSAGGFPWGTFTVNAAGSFVIGWLWALSEAGFISSSPGFFLFTGVLGGFTTFSAFSLETINLFRSGETGLAMAYFISTNIICMTLAGAGFYCSKSLFIR
jgi:CrcB protein